MEKELRLSEERFRSIIDTAHDAFISMDSGGLIREWNARAEEMFGWSREEAVGQTLSSLIIPPADREAHERGLKHVIATGGGPVMDQRVEVTALRRDGTQFPVELAVWKTGPADAIMFNAFLHDITERRRSENALARYKLLFSKANDLAYVCDAEGNVLYLNEMFERLSGHKPEEFIGKSFAPLFDEEDLAIASENYERTLKGECPQFEVAFKDTGILCEYTNLPHRDDAGAIIGVFGIARDITERRRAELAMRAVSDHLQLSIDRMPVGYILWDTNGKVARWNPAAERIFGFTSEEAVGRSLLELVVPEEVRPVVAEVLAKLVAGEEASYSEPGNNLRKDGSIISCQWYNTPLIAATGEVSGVLSMALDVTEQQLAEEALRESESKFRSLTENTPNIVLTINRDGEILYVNHTPKGLDPNQAIGTSMYALVEPDFHESVEKHVRAVFDEGKPSQFEAKGTGPNGRQSHYLSSMGPVFGNDGEVVSAIISTQDITERKRAYDELQKYSLLVENSNDFIAIASLGGKVQFVNKAGRELVGLDPDEDVESKTVAEFLTEEGLRASQDVEVPAVQAHGSWSGETTLRHFRTGSAIPVLVNSFLIKDSETGAPLGLATVQRDITERKRAVDELLKLSTAVEQSPSIVVITDPEGNIEYVNRAFTQITGYSPDDVIGQNPRIWKSGETPQDEYKRLWEAITSGEAWSGEFHNRKKNGELFWVSASVSAIRDEDGATVHFLGVQEDITERKQAEETIRHLAFHDGLTNLPNRTLFIDRFKVALTRAKRTGQMTAVIFLDLDRFKTVNDTVGHTFGDQLLRDVAERLTGLVREGDTVARMGGDEFTLLLPDIERMEDVFEVAERIIATFRQPWLVDGHEFHVTASLGIATYPDDGDDAESLLRKADTGMYRAKDEGRDTYRLYTESMNVRIAERLALENSLRHGLERSEFVVHYQPQVDISSGRIVGTEALVRWQHPERGLVPPMEFIPVVEETGLIVPLGTWVLQTACAQNVAWQQAGHTPMPVAVNLSARQFQERDLLDTVTQVLEESGMDPQYLQLEITEGVAMQDAESTATTLHALRKMGVQIAIDDFGTGHSSLSYLKRFPIDVLKIDRSFVDDLTADPNDAAIASTIIAMAKSLSLRVIAEGVETEEQLAFLKEHGCDEMQGFLFSKPVPAVELEKLLAPNKRRSRPKAFVDSS